MVRAVAGHTDIAAARLARVLRDVMPSADPGVHPMSRLLANQFRPWRLGATMLSALGVLALLVASLGLYGLISFNASRRSHEMSVRMALGSPRARLMALIIRDAIRTVVAGIVIGRALTLASGRLLSALLYDTSPHDPSVLGAVTGVMLVTALLSGLAPAFRAARADPAAVLRAEC
jgi:ABC-type antimicrobial peptide transport system permease subunit